MKEKDLDQGKQTSKQIVYYSYNSYMCEIIIERIVLYKKHLLCTSSKDNILKNVIML